MPLKIRKKTLKQKMQNKISYSNLKIHKTYL